MYPLIPTPSQESIKNLWNSFVSNNVYKTKNSRIFFTPHAGIEYSGFTALESYCKMIDNPQNVWIFGTNHNPNLTNINNDTMFLNLTRNNGQDASKYFEVLYNNSKFAQIEHSININLSIIAPLLNSTSKIYPWLLPQITDQQTFEIVINAIIYFLNLHDRNIVIFTSDMSHESNKSSQEILTRESDLVISILNKNYENITEKISKLSLCGPDNLILFLMLINKIGGFPCIDGYSDSVERTYLWTNEQRNYIVSYLSMTCCFNEQEYLEYKFQTKCVLHKSFFMSLLYNRLKNCLSNITLPLVYNFNDYNYGLFITLKNRDNKTRACIGQFYTQFKTLYVNIFDISKTILSDAIFRWQSQISLQEFNSKNIKCEFTIMMNEQKQINPNDFIKYQELQNKNNGYIIICDDKKTGTFIPSVWKENPTWTAVQYLEQLLLKAGSPNCQNFELLTFATYVI
jgi:AmmeMemoRadiSam system protein B